MSRLPSSSLVGRILNLPLLVILMGIGSTSMLVPAGYGWFSGEFFESRVFFYGAILFGFLTSFLALAMADRPRSNRPRRHLMALLGLFVLLPIMLAVPFHQALRNTSFLNAYFEMVSALTTTGATLFDTPDRLAETLHLWRALVGWMGGLFIWVSAIAILAPMALGGFEVRARFSARQDAGGIGGGLSQITNVADISQRIRAYGLKLFPVYAGLTLVLWIGLILAGDSAFVAACHAMSTMATSGISPVGGLTNSGSGFAGEAIIAVFFIFAISRLTFATDMQSENLRSLLGDAEIRMAFAVILIVPAFLFLRHWIGAYEVDEETNILAGLTSLWGSVFTVLSFLTTTGFESSAWAASRDWSGLQTPGLVLTGLALIGGGVATTAGGAKLMRVYALYLHGRRELEKLVHPSSVGGSGTDARHMRGRGAYMSWVFFMLLAMSLAIVTLALSFTGLDFESTMILTISALTTTGPLAQVASSTPFSYADLSDPAKVIMAGAMVLGRLETLAIIALFNPDSWRR
ncbi:MULTISPECIES: TrkH family potassium uptake protein [unclassified Aliiroseovarius]|uniref:TrkH family potassium uptake protein n=1 Tax=unclassified Aliiroseovarius TaxID=2623558 RepID=UPI0015696F54|nr:MULTISPECIES: TrkH family potassium uptake protein [unclassified Aliiroseovarius]NRP11869.1 Trk system potassium uptake protein TrkG [Aliiroseovarius sp. xm-d-517]NRP42195.1 Trk system potassium uptake protein TrkG [Aliiroseovarius sp. xm-m-339-2]NRP63202.1 Trk system potassium uptake protein TrkG [Aliiroseovarius sp. xm-a-151]